MASLKGSHFIKVVDSAIEYEASNIVSVTLSVSKVILVLALWWSLYTLMFIEYYSLKFIQQQVVTNIIWNLSNSINLKVL